MSGHEGLQMGLPVCMGLQLVDYPFNDFRFLSCSNVRSFHWSYFLGRITFDLTALNSICDLLFNLPCLQNLYITISPVSGLDSLIRVFFYDAREQGVWRDIRNVEMKVWCVVYSERSHLFDRIVGHQHLYEKSWKEFTVTKEEWMVIVRASVYSQGIRVNGMAQSSSGVLLAVRL